MEFRQSDNYNSLHSRIFSFVYSSQKNHELCYATSRYPDRDFRFGGTLVSNGDVGLDGRKESERTNATGTTHGSIEQMCAEPLQFLPDGSFRQAEMTSCGLNQGDLPGSGLYPAAICCSLSNGKMPHIANRMRTDIPCITHDGGEWFITNAEKGTEILYKYFDFQANTQLSLTARKNGSVQIFLQDLPLGTLDFCADRWTKRTLPIPQSQRRVALRFAVTAGNLDILEFEITEAKA